MKEGPGLLKERPDHLVCACMEVMYSEIKAAIEGGVDDFHDLSDTLMVGTGCSSCVEEVFEMIKRYKNRLS